MIDVSEIIDDPDFASLISVTSLGMGSYANEGAFTPGVPVTRDWMATVQPASQADKDNYLAEGERQDSAIRIWSRQNLHAADGAGVLADTLVWQGQNYRVAFSKPWDLHGYYFVIAVGYVS